jgi:hypothetical protein
MQSGSFRQCRFFAAKCHFSAIVEQFLDYPQQAIRPMISVLKIRAEGDTR